MVWVAYFADTVAKRFLSMVKKQSESRETWNKLNYHSPTQAL